MKRIVIAFIIVFVLALNTSGCVKRVSLNTIEKARIDQDETVGNKGYISGTKPPSDTPIEKQKTRRIYQVTLEIPPYAEWKNFRKEQTPDKEIWGNRGYVYGGPQSMVTPEEAAPVPIILPEEVYKEADAILPPEPVKVEPVAEDVKSISYKVKKGDTLQKISKKVYGTSKRWQEIFEFNKGSLKNPNKIYPGQTILIPQD